MKFEARTLQILKNFVGINKNIAFKAGSELKTISTAQSILATAQLQENFPKDFGIADLGRLLNTLSLFPDPEMKFEDNFILIGTKDQNVKYVYANPEDLVKPSDRSIDFNEDFTFKLSEKNLSEIIKAGRVLTLPHIVLQGDGKTLNIQCIDVNNSTSDTFNLKIGSSKVKCNLVIKADNLEVLQEDYMASISLKGILKLTTKDLTYLIACDQMSRAEE